MTKKLIKLKAWLRNVAYKFTKEDGVEFIISFIIILLALIWLYSSHQNDFSNIIDLTIFFAIVATMLLQIVARFTKNRIINWIEDDIKLDSNYKKLTKRYPPIFYPDGNFFDPLMQIDNSFSDFVNLKVLQKYGAEHKCRLPIIVDYTFFNNISIAIEDCNTRYEPPADINQCLQTLMKAHKTSSIYNQLNIRIDEWRVIKDVFIMRTSRTTYFDSLITNRAMDFSWPTGTNTRDQYQYGPFVPDLTTESPLSNHLGFNGIIVSKDEQIPFIHRSRIVSIGKKTYGTSIGASLKTQYALNQNRIFDVNGLEMAIIQEIQDEIKLERNDLVNFSVNSNVIAAYRDLVEGGKPQLLFYAKSNLTSKEITYKFNSKIASAKNTREEWDTKSKVFEDGDKLLWLSLNDLYRASFCENMMVVSGKPLYLTPSSIASILIFLQYCRNRRTVNSTDTIIE